jgi:hypothetical protein
MTNTMFCPHGEKTSRLEDCPYCSKPRNTRQRLSRFSGKYYAIRTGKHHLTAFWAPRWLAPLIALWPWG